MMSRKQQRVMPELLRFIEWFVIVIVVFAEARAEAEA